MLRGWAVGSVLVLIQVAWGGPGIAVSGGIQAGANTVPLLFTWSSSITVQGSGWTSGEPVAISLEGPLNSPGVPVSAIGLGSAIAGNLGTFSTPLIVPYDQAITGPKARIPRPGYYRVRATGTVSGTAIASNNINLCPATYTGAGGIDWSRERGSRDGILPGALRAYSPERSDPEWISVWDNRPAQIYGTVGGVTPTGANQVAHISFEDDPLAHYAHDVNAILQPDPQYLWTVGTANYYQNPNEDGTDRPGRIELEWESLNGGNTKTYGTGQIGLPVWATPGTGDRVYVVGRWVLDAGHPEIGDRTEIHPARLIAVMRQRPTVSAGGATSAQVDIYVSGHGGGANQYPSGMDDLLGQGGYGGGRLRDVLNASDQSVYYRPGPLGFPDATALEVLVLTLVGETLSSTPYPSAGPSAFSWGAPAPEQQPINDMDYDFDVPLPPPPDGATSVKVEVITQAQHTTAVAETVTFPKAGGSLPAVAHVHLPYNGADNGIYARTLKFSWNTASMPEYHFRVRLDRIRVNSNPGEWHLWSDAGGQWTNLSNLAPSLLQTTQNGIIAPPGAQFDLYLRGTDTIRFLVQGYRAQCIDHEFGALFGMSSYSAGIKLLTDCGPVNNDDLGGALLELPALPSSQGSYTVMADSTDRPGGGSFQVDLTVDFVSGPSASAECQGRGLLAPVISAAGIVGAGLSAPPVNDAVPDGLLTIFGTGFAPTGTNGGLTAADVQNGMTPANLACTCVAVNHHLAPLTYVTSGQINAQAPIVPGDETGNVQVIADCGATNQMLSAAQAVGAQPSAPQFFLFKVNAAGAGPIAATDAITGSLIGAIGLQPGGSFAPAKPGQYIALYATGLGLTDPPFAPGMVANQAAPAAASVSVMLNGIPMAATDILYAGAAPGYVGLYQVNIHIPTNQPDGDVAVTLTIGGIPSPAGAFLTVQH